MKPCTMSSSFMLPWGTGGAGCTLGRPGGGMWAQPLASRAADAATATAASGRSLATDGHLAVGPRPGRLVVAPPGALGRARRAGRAGPGTGARAVDQAGAVQGDDLRREADHLRVDITGAGPERQGRPGELLASRPGQRQPEHRAAAGLAPG